MNITNESIRIIHCLESFNFSVKELSEILKIDTRRIKYNISCIGSVFGNTKLSVEELHSMISKDPVTVKTILKNLQVMTPDERKLFIVLNFMKNEILNQNKTSEILCISRKTITEDIADLKKGLEKFNLKIKSLNSIGVQLIGKEEDKRLYFQYNFYKLYMENSFLPKPLNELWKEFEKSIRSAGLDTLAEEILSTQNVHFTTPVILNLEFVLLTAFLRENSADKVSESEHIYLPQTGNTSFEKVEKILDSYDFITPSERKLIHEFCIKINIDEYETSHSKQFEKTQDFLNYLGENSKYPLNYSKNTLFSIFTRLELIEFKYEMGISQLYLFNKNSSKDYLELFYDYRKLFREYFQNRLDSFDEVFLFQTIIKDVQITATSSIIREGELLVAYDFLPIFFIQDICKNLEEHLPNGTVKYLSARSLESYLEKNNVKMILTFENIHIPEGDHKVKRFSFPMTQFELESLKSF